MNTFKKQPQSRLSKQYYFVGLVLVLVVLIMVFLYLGKGKSKYEGLDNASVELLVPQIMQVTIDPVEAYSVDSVRVVPVLKKPLNHVVYHYQWYLNGKVLPDATLNILDNKYYRSGDKIYCSVLATAGKYDSDLIMSPTITIKNAKPAITLTAIAPFNVPGRFQYQITAADPDGDPLTYRLVSPLDRGITIDEKTGLIQWNIPAVSTSDGATVGNDTVIIFEVKDSAGEAVTSSLTLNLISGKEVPI